MYSGINISVHLSVFISILSGKHKGFVQIKNHAFSTVSPTLKSWKGVPWIAMLSACLPTVLFPSIPLCPKSVLVDILRPWKGVPRIVGTSAFGDFLFRSGLWKRVRSACDQVDTTAKDVCESQTSGRAKAEVCQQEKRNSPREMWRGSIHGFGIEEGERLASHRDRL